MNKAEGTSGNDTIEGLFGTAANATFNAGDTIDGKGGNDVLSLIANGNTASDPVTVKDIDLINVQVANTTGATLDALLFTGVGAIHSKDSVGALTINNLKLGTAVGINNGDKNLTATFVGTSGTSDEVTVELNKAGSKAGSTITRSTIDVSSTNTIEAVKVNVLGGDNYVTIQGGNQNKTLTVVGDGTGLADINTTNAVTKVDASAYKGKLDLTLGGTSNVSVTGTEQDDVLRFGTTLNSADSIDGKGGSDVLRATLSASQTPTVTGVEKGILTFDSANGVYNASKTTGMTVVDVISKDSNADDITLSGVKAELATINALRQASGDGADDFGDISVTYATGSNASATLNIGGAADHQVGNVTIANATSVTIQSKDKKATINGNQTYAEATELSYIAKDGEVVATAGEVTADKVETLNFTADGKKVQVDNAGNSFDKLKVLNVTATGALADVVAVVSPTGGAAATISEVNVKSADATGQVDVTVNGTTGATNAFTISTVNFEVNGTSGTQTLTIDTNSNAPTIAALNVKAAENATATVVLNETGAGNGYNIQGGVFEGKGNITIQGGAKIDAIDLRNIDRTLLSSNSTLTIQSGGNGDIYGTNGNDTIDVTTGNVTIHFADSLASNGKDTIQNFEYGSGKDKLDFNAFLGGSKVVGSSFSANVTTADLDLTDNSGENVGLLYNASNYTLDASKITTGTPGTGQIKLADNGKAVIIVTSASATNDVDAFSVYYVYDADTGATQNWQVELVGSVTTTDANLSDATNFGALFA